MIGKTWKENCPFVNRCFGSGTLNFGSRIRIMKRIRTAKIQLNSRKIRIQQKSERYRVFKKGNYTFFLTNINKKLINNKKPLHFLKHNIVDWIFFSNIRPDIGYPANETGYHAGHWMSKMPDIQWNLKIKYTLPSQLFKRFGLIEVLMV